MDHMVFILNDFWRANMRDPNEQVLPERLLKYLNDAEENRKAEEKEEFLARNMSNRAAKSQVYHQKENVTSTKEFASLKELAEGFKAEWRRGYSTNDWIASMNAIYVLLEQIAVCLASLNLLGQGFDAVDGLLGTLVGEQQGLTAALAKAIDSATYQEPPADFLPKLQHRVALNNDGKLVFDSLSDVCRSNGEPLFTKVENPTIQAKLDILQKGLDDHFQAGIIAWLDIHGYEPQKVQGPRNSGEPEAVVYTGKFVDKDDPERVLTTEVFEELKVSEDHPERGLDALLKGKFNVDFQHTVSPSLTRSRG
jgi:hypothetical protein